MSRKATIAQMAWFAGIDGKKPQNGFIKAPWHDDREVVDTMTWGQNGGEESFLMAGVVYFSCRFLVYFSMSLDTAGAVDGAGVREDRS